MNTQERAEMESKMAQRLADPEEQAILAERKWELSARAGLQALLDEVPESLEGRLLLQESLLKDAKAQSERTGRTIARMDRIINEGVAQTCLRIQGRWDG